MWPEEEEDWIDFKNKYSGYCTEADRRYDAEEDGLQQDRMEEEKDEQSI